MPEWRILSEFNAFKTLLRSGGRGSTINCVAASGQGLSGRLRHSALPCWWVASFSRIFPRARRVHPANHTLAIVPPLQIWRCPMDVAARGPLQSTVPRIWEASEPVGAKFSQVILAQVVEGGADIDISGLEFDFLRSICVWGAMTESGVWAV